MFSFEIATEEGPFEAEMSCSQNKCTTCITLENHSPFYHVCGCLWDQCVDPISVNFNYVYITSNCAALLKIVAGSGDKDIRLLRIYSREVERKHCPGPYQDTSVFEETASADYSVPQEVEKFALHNLISNKMALSAELEEKIQYSNMEVPPPDQRSEYRRLVAEAERRVIQEGKFDVVLCTCSEASSARIQRHFTPFQCIVYEASLASEPETVATIARSSHQVVLIGDHSSVCPPVCSQVAGLAGLGVSLFEKYARQLTEEDEYGLYSFLEEQYKMVSCTCREGQG